jgi:2-dehydropantoate 2-reductase
MAGDQRVAVIGAGAIGGVLASAAHAAGHHVTLCVRTPFDRLVLETPDGTENVPVDIVSDPSEAPEVDWILLTTKVQDVGNTGPWLRKLDNGRAPIAVVQNGVEHRESVASFGLRAPLLPALIYVAAERVAPGRVVRRSAGNMIVPADGLGAAFVDLLAGAGPTVARSEDFYTETWRKLLNNLAGNPITALTLRRLDVFREPGIRTLARGVLTEAVAVARAEGADLDSTDAEKVLAAYTDHFPPENGSSMLYDRLAGLPTEHEHITGPLVRAAQRHDIPVPLNETLLTLMRALQPTRQSI